MMTWPALITWPIAALATALAAILTLAIEFRHDVSATSYGYLDRDRWSGRVSACVVEDATVWNRRRDAAMVAVLPRAAEPVGLTAAERLDRLVHPAPTLQPTPQEIAAMQRAAADFDGRDPLIKCTATNP